jgi:hypothetical protein
LALFLLLVKATSTSPLGITETEPSTWRITAEEGGGEEGGEEGRGREGERRGEGGRERGREGREEGREGRVEGGRGERGEWREGDLYSNHCHSHQVHQQQQQQQQQQKTEQTLPCLACKGREGGREGGNWLHATHYIGMPGGQTSLVLIQMSRGIQFFPTRS